jgi:predicted RecA/RadA family phage recombinase
MAKNFIQPGDTVPVPAPYDVTSGGGVLVGSLFGIAQYTATSGNEVEINTVGVFDVPKVSAQAWAVGDPIYFVLADKNFTKTASTNVLIGHALAVAANPSAIGRVRLSV